VLRKDAHDHKAGVLEQPEIHDEFVDNTQTEQPLVYVIFDDDTHQQVFNEGLKHFEEICFQHVSLDSFFKEKKKKQQILGAFLLLEQVDDYGLAYVIQVKSVIHPKCPLILGGPQWTRSDVIKAIRYGAEDIILTPPEVQDICHKIEKHIYCKIQHC
jgi:hypothetical protein